MSGRSSLKKGYTLSFVNSAGREIYLDLAVAFEARLIEPVLSVSQSVVERATLTYQSDAG
jgi:hypothetical protein